MAIYENNSVTAGLRGKLGKSVVFKQVRGKTVLSNIPRRPKSESRWQKENRYKFKSAVYAAKHLIKDPVQRARYEEIALKNNLPNAYTAALTEKLRGSIQPSKKKKPKRSATALQQFQTKVTDNNVSNTQIIVVPVFINNNNNTTDATAIQWSLNSSALAPQTPSSVAICNAITAAIESCLKQFSVQTMDDRQREGDDYVLSPGA